MTQVAQIPKAIFNGTVAGTSGPFIFNDAAGTPIYVNSSAHIVAVRYLTADAESGTAEAVTVTGAPGYVTIQTVLPLTDGQRLLVTRVTPRTQYLLLNAGQDFSVKNIEAALDWLALQIQEMGAQVDRLNLGAGDGLEANAFSAADLGNLAALLAIKDELIMIAANDADISLLAGFAADGTLADLSAGLTAGTWPVYTAGPGVSLALSQFSIDISALPDP